MIAGGPQLRVAFFPGVARWWEKQRLAVKYLKMRLEGILYPDVYCLPFFFTDHFDFLSESEYVAPGRYDLILSELQAGDGQLEYLESLVAAGHPVAVIPGPPEILARELNESKLNLVRRILTEAPHVWAYSPAVANFCDGLFGRRATVIPWPFDYDSVVRLGRKGERSGGRARVLLQIPLRFFGTTQNFPFVVKAVLADIWRSLPSSLQARLSLHTFVYTREDREVFATSRFAEGLPICLEQKLRYRSFVRLVGECEAVVNLTVGSVLGRITFLAAALGKPGIFSKNSELSRALYPGSVVELLDTARLRELLTEMLFGLAEGHSCARLLPREELAAEIGDFRANAGRMRQLLAGNYPCVASQAS